MERRRVRMCACARWLAFVLCLALPQRSEATDIVQGTVGIGLESVFNTFASGLPDVTVPIDMDRSGDGNLYVAAISGQVLSVDDGAASVYLDLASSADVPFTTSFAGGLLAIAFHPDYSLQESNGYRKFYTYSTDWKTVNQSGNSNVSPGNELTGLPDFWHPEMYAPASGGNPLTDWTNPNNPGFGNTDFDHFNVVREWTAAEDGSTIDTNIAPRTILRMAHGYAGKGSHNGGGFRFGPDGYLYLSTGDGGGNAGKDYDADVNNTEDGHTDGTGNGQDRTVVYGKVLRIDPTASVKNSTNGQYGIPADNPYVLDNSNPDYLDEIYAFGFRNPWKLSFDDDPGGDGAIYLADVGQHHREEIDVIVPGGNYGWGYLEGNVRLVHEGSATGESDPLDFVDGTDGTPVRIPPGGFPSFESTVEAPLVDYLTRRQTVNGQLVGDGTAVTGGFVYRGNQIPELQGMYVFGDYSIAGSPPPGIEENIARLFYIDPGASTHIQEFRIDFGEDLLGRLLGIGRDDEGELLALLDNGHVAQLLGTPDRDGDGDVDGSDFLQLQQSAVGLTSVWKNRYGTEFASQAALAQLPEPSTWSMTLGVAYAILVRSIRRRRPQNHGGTSTPSRKRHNATISRLLSSSKSLAQPSH